MVALLQRVSEAQVSVDSKCVGQIGPGLLVLLGIDVKDDSNTVQWLANKVSQLRIFSDAAGKMNQSVLDVGGQILVVSQFTLLADAAQGNRPSYTKAARPEQAIPLYEAFCKALELNLSRPVEKGVFGADMKVSLINDGPVTLILDTQQIMPGQRRTS
jgi:D-tyrosyl-tRNA(Tyr) deacylase